MLQLRAVAALLFVLACAGCASVTQGTTAALRIDTVTSESKEVVGADCTLTNDKETKHTRSGSTTIVHRSGKTLEVVCRKEGLPDAVGSLLSRVNTAVYGNILVGGLIGAAVDANSGAAYRYPSWVQLVFGEHAVFDATNEIEGVAMRAPGVPASGTTHETATASARPASGAMPPAQVATAQGPITSPGTASTVEPPAPHVSPAVSRPSGESLAAVAGRTFEYRLEDHVTGLERTVMLHVDYVDGDRVTFNGGSRIEDLHGAVIRDSGAVAGEADAASPPGGWMKPGAQVGSEWQLAYEAKGSQQHIRMELHAQAVDEEVLTVSGQPVRTLRVEFTGYTSRAITSPVAGTGHYRATAWYSPGTGRLVRFEVRAQGGLLASKFDIDEGLELVAVH